MSINDSTCPKCGHLFLDENFCPKCGTPNPSPGGQPTNTPSATSVPEAPKLRSRSNKKAAIIVGSAVSAVVILLAVSYAMNTYALSHLQYRSVPGGSGFDFVSMSATIQMEACNPTSYPASFDKFHVTMLYKNKDFATMDINGGTINPNEATSLKGTVALNREAVAGLFLQGFANGLSGNTQQFNQDDLSLTAQLDAKILGFIPYSQSKSYTYSEFQNLMSGSNGSGTHPCFQDVSSSPSNQQSSPLSVVTPAQKANFDSTLASEYPHTQVIANGYPVQVLVASTQSQKTEGASIFNQFDENQGMLFPFPDEGNYGFWMKGMSFPLDIIWINADGQVVHVEQNVSPCSSDNSCQVYNPSEKAKYVLEVHDGFVDRKGITTGMQLVSSQWSAKSQINSEVNPQVNSGDIITTLLTPTTPGAYALQTRTSNGDPAVTIVQFGDYQDNSDGRFHAYTQNALISDLVNTGKAKFMYKDFTINDNVYKPRMGSSLASEAAYCAGEQGKFWAYHDELFRIQKPEGTEWISKPLLEQVAVDVGIQNNDQFTNCLDSQKYSSEVQNNNALAEKLGLNAVPTFVILAQGKTPEIIVGAQPLSSYESVVNSMGSLAPQNLQIGVQDVRVIKQDQTHARVTVSFSVYNPNDVSVLLQNVHYTATVEGQQITTGDTGEPAQGFLASQASNTLIVAHGTVTVSDNELALSNDLSAPTWDSLVNGNPVYTIDGNYSFRETEGVQTTFNQGDFSLRFQ